MRLARAAAGVLAAAFLVGCAGGAAVDEERTLPGQPVVVEGGEYRDITVPELQAMLADKDFPLINVHIPFAGDLPGTDASIPFNRIEDHLDQLPADRNARIVLYCRTGPMSTTAAAVLATLGYTDVYNLVGGLQGWIEWGLPMAEQ